MERETYSLKSRSEQTRDLPDKESQLLRPTWWEYLLPALVVLSLVLACVIVSPKKYFWNDELYSYYFTSDPSFSGMLAAFHDKINNTPILYFVLGWLWDKVFTSSELSLRLFSTLGMGLAALLSWLTLRRTYGFMAVSFGVVGVFCTSQIILLQNAEARMYGLFLALCAAALYLYDCLNSNPKPSAQLLLLNMLVHTGIVHTHLFGGFYSGAILFAIFLSNRYFGRVRYKVYGSIVLSWLTILLYLPSFLIQADAGKPRTWIPLPSTSDLLDLLNLFAPSFFQLLVPVLLLVLAAPYLYQYRRYNIASAQDQTKQNERAEVPLLIFAAVFILVPVFIWLFSRTIKPIFYDRYMIPSALGWVVFITYIASRMTQGAVAKGRGYTSWASRVLACLVLAALMLYPIHDAITVKKQNPPDTFSPTAYDELPVVLPFSHIFLQVQHYSAQRQKYFFILDWEAASSPHSGLFSPQEYKHLEALRRNYPERFKNNILTSEEFLQKFDRFLVADYPDYTRQCPLNPKGMATARSWIDIHCPQWVEVRLLNNRHYKVTYLNNDYWYTMLLVEKQP